MAKYVYDGPVMEFDTCIVHRWVGETIANSEAKAKNNLTYQFKTKHNRLPGTKITLPGKLRVVS